MDLLNPNPVKHNILTAKPFHYVNQFIGKSIFLYYKMILKKTLTILLSTLIIVCFNQVFAQTETQDDYQKAISSADGYFQAGDYINAKASYQYASKLKPSEQYPKDQLAETVVKLREKMQVMELYNTEILEADRHFKKAEYEEAKAKYKAALKIQPNESYPKEKITEIENLVAANNAKDAEYETAIENGDKLIGYKKYSKSKEAFETALSIKPEEQYPMDRIAELIVLIEEAGKVDENYAEIIAGADRLYNLKYYRNAKEEYNKALQLKPGEVYPENQIKEIDVLLVDKNNFDQLIEEADQFYVDKDLENAKSKYQAALTIYPAESYPKDMIDRINKALNALKGQDELYQQSIASAEDFASKQDYSNAIKEFENAASIKPNETYPKDRIQEIKNIQSNREADELAYNKFIQTGEQLFTARNFTASKTAFENASNLKPDASYPKEKITEINAALKNQEAVQESFNLSVAKAEAFVEQKDYENAIKEYQNALIIIPGTKLASDRIEEIKTIRDSEMDKDKQFDKLIAEGDKLLEKSSYTEAKAKYEAASKIDVSQTYPKTKISEINIILANALAQQNSYDELIKQADLLFNQKSYELAKIEYQKALQLKPGENYPSDQIKEIDKLIKNQQLSFSLYNQTIAEADQLFLEGKYEKARSEYVTASATKPSEQYPKTQIFEIDKLLEEQRVTNEQYRIAIIDADAKYKDKFYAEALTRYNDALVIKPDEVHPTERIDEINAILSGQAEESKAYNDAIAQADLLFEQAQYDQAKLSFMKAGNIKPKEQYPKDKITEIETLVNNQKASRAEYNRFIAAADRMFEAGEYDKAKIKYTEAKAILPEEKYPDDKTAEIATIIAAQLATTQSNYNNHISAADAFLSEKKYNEAMLKYREALKVKPNEQYPIDQIASIEREVSNFEELKGKYQLVIADADKLFKAKDYREAKLKYQEAMAMIPTETYPSQKIEEINGIYKAEMQKVQQEYDKAIADADKFLAAKVYDQSLDSYRNAAKIKPEESYPDQMISQIMRIFEENAVRDLLSSSVSIENMGEEEYSFDPVSVTDRKSNFIFVKARNLGENEFKIIMSYGKGATKNGGFSLPIPANQDMQEFIIPVGKQYKWFTEDNNWIKLVPQGGSVEVSIIKISRAN
jgi:tetratricopeptide (TPR) repeat protein